MYNTRNDSATLWCGGGGTSCAAERRGSDDAARKGRSFVVGKNRLGVRKRLRGHRRGGHVVHPCERQVLGQGVAPLSSRTWGKAASTAVVMAMLAAGCGGSGGPAASGELPAPPPSTTGKAVPRMTSRAETEQAVLDAYLAHWDAWEGATNPADPEFPGLMETQTGPALQAAVDQIVAWKASGRVAYDPENSISETRAEVVSVDSAEAVVRDCNVDDGLVVIAATGEVVNDRVQTLLFEAHMVIEDGRWKLSSLLIEDEWEGVAGCAVE